MRYAFALLAVAACTSSTPSTTSAAVGSLPDLPPVGSPVTATVTRVLDGDSMEISIDGESDELRLFGINAPEGDECAGDLARDAMIEAVANRSIVLYGTDRDQFGRLLAFVEVDGVPVGWQAVRRGLALALSIDHPRLDAYAEAEDDAFVEEIGMWAVDACGPDTEAIIGIEEVVWDPPGRDSDDLNGEFVRLSADGPVDLTGWVLRDESTRWRYQFPSGFTLSDAVTVRTGCGDDDSDELYWCAADPLWSNSGDTVLVMDPAGNVVARLTYGAKQDR